MASWNIHPRKVCERCEFTSIVDFLRRQFHIGTFWSVYFVSDECWTFLVRAQNLMRWREPSPDSVPFLRLHLSSHWVRDSLTALFTQCDNHTHCDIPTNRATNILRPQRRLCVLSYYEDGSGSGLTRTMKSTFIGLIRLLSFLLYLKIGNFAIKTIHTFVEDEICLKLCLKE